MGNVRTEKTKRRRAKNPEKERERRQRKRLRSKERKAKMTPEERAELKGHLRSRRTVRLRNLLRRLSEAQNHNCCYCGSEAWLEGIECGVNREKWNEATKEHLIPRSKGGTYGKYNLVMACNSCNNARGDMSHEEFVALIEKETKPIIPTVRDEKAKQDKLIRDKERQDRFAFYLVWYLSLLTKEQRQTVDGWIKKYESKQYLSGIKNVRKRKTKRSVTISKIRYRVKLNQIALTV